MGRPITLVWVFAVISSPGEIARARLHWSVDSSLLTCERPSLYLRMCGSNTQAPAQYPQTNGCNSFLNFGSASRGVKSSSNYGSAILLVIHEGLITLVCVFIVITSPGEVAWQIRRYWTANDTFVPFTVWQFILTVF